MSIWRISARFILCTCLSIYSLPSFASVDQTTPVVQKLSEQEMAGIVGSGNVDVEMTDYKLGGMQAEATIANRSILVVSYEMNVTNSNGATLQTIASGSVSPGQVILVKGNPPYGGTQNQYIQVRAFNEGIGAFEVVDSSWAPSSVDSDDDGLTDSLELAHGLNPYNAGDANLDFDGDGLTNKDEILIHRTEILNPDTDGDSIQDGVELAHGLDPTNSADGALDPDQDFVSTADEINVYGTDFNTYDAGLATDTDGDGVNDTLETALGMNPTDPVVASPGGDTPTDKQQMHVLNRLTYGATINLANEIAAMGTQAWLADQLITLDFTNLTSDPAQILREDYPTQQNEVERVGAIRPLHSIKHLQTRMALFWDNHFNTEKNKVNYTEAELYEEDLFFVNALGSFKALLVGSATSHAMLQYLDLRTSKTPSPNENYAREVMELHTLGSTTADNVYGPEDVQALSRILSGWSSKSYGNLSRYRIWSGPANGIVQRVNYEFVFNSGNHDADVKTFLGEHFPAGGQVEEGMLALDMLATHPETARFICEKMAKTFVSDEPDPATVSACQTKFVENRDAPDQIAQALKALITSAEFTAEANQHAKFKDNQEYMFGLGRLLSVNAIGAAQPGDYLKNDAFAEAIERTGQGLFVRSPPTGYKEHAGQWITTNSAIQRFREGNELLNSGYSPYLGAKSTIALIAELESAGLTTSGEVIARLFKVMLGGDYDLKHIEMAYWILHPGGEAFVLNEIKTRAKLMELIARIAQLPEYNLH